jgi:hypothetical protein
MGTYLFKVGREGKNEQGINRDGRKSWKVAHMKQRCCQLTFIVVCSLEEGHVEYGLDWPFPSNLAFTPELS